MSLQSGKHEFGRRVVPCREVTRQIFSAYYSKILIFNLYQIIRHTKKKSFEEWGKSVDEITASYPTSEEIESKYKKIF